MINKENFSLILQSPSSLITKDIALQEAALRVAIEAQMHGYISLSLAPNEIAQLPKALIMHLTSIASFWHAQKVQTQKACELLAAQLNTVNIPVLLLKGAAYIAGDKANSKGRLISDIDILVRKENLSKVEEVLSSNGWKAEELDDYDEKYYREWSHELPPFVHLETGTTVDIHHNLLPSSANKNIDINKIFNFMEEVGDNLYIPSEAHLVLHSSIHLLLNDDIEKGLRDCFDLHFLILSHFKREQSLSHLKTLFSDSNCGSEFAVLMVLLDRLFGKTSSVYREYLSKHPAKHTTRLKAKLLYVSVFPPSSFLLNNSDSIARLITYMNGHLSKMPFTLLLKHSLYKSYRTIIKKLLGESVFRK